MSEDIDIELGELGENGNESTVSGRGSPEERGEEEEEKEERDCESNAEPTKCATCCRVFCKILFYFAVAICLLAGGMVLGHFFLPQTIDYVTNAFSPPLSHNETGGEIFLSCVKHLNLT